MNPGFRLLLVLALPLVAQAQGLLAIDNPARIEVGNKAYASVQAFAGNDQVAMREYAGDWAGSYTPRDGANIGLLAVRAESGLQWAGWRLGALYRADALVQTNRDTSDLVQQYKSRSGYNLNRSYQLDYQVQGFEADGARASKSFQLNGDGAWPVSLGVGVSYLRGQRVTLNAIGGGAVSLNTKDFNANARQSVSDSLINTTDLASFNAPYGRQASASGSGYAFDVGAVLLHASSGTSLELAVADLVGQIAWRDLPTNVANYNNATKYYDASGYVNFNPSSSRTSSYQNLEQTLDPKLLLGVNFPLGDVEWNGLASFTRGYCFPQLGVSYRASAQWRVRADYDLRFHTLGVSLQHSNFTVSLRSDNAALDAAKAYGLSAGLSLPF